jgi:hypothetical protein
MMMHCQYCGRPTEWNLRVKVPPCCPGCKKIPAMLATVWCAFGLVTIALAAAMWNSLP